ncbi:MAG: hypothetical protein HYV63_25785 [Candidatus Schekmanbacteria bacterium]|nr:hypothetical protein [Candidatus Schekmanbacteria bacterium]
MSMHGYRSGAGAILLFACCVCAPDARAAPKPPEPPATEVESLELQVADLQSRLESARQALRAEAQAATDSAAPAGAASAADAEKLEAALAEVQSRLERLEAAVAEQGDTLASLQELQQQATHVGVYGTLRGDVYEGRSSVLDAESLELILSGEPHEGLSFFAEIELERAAAVGSERGGEVVVEQAHTSLSLSRLLNLRAGVLLVPFGNYNIDHYAPVRDVISRPLVSQVVAPGDWTDNGVEIYGEHSSGAATVRWEACVIAGLDARLDAYGTRDARQPFGVDNNGDKAIVGRVSVARLGSLELGLSGYSGKYDDAGQERLIGWAADGLARLGPVKLTGEVNRLTAGRAAGGSAIYAGYNLRATMEVGHLLVPDGVFGAAFPDAEIALVVQYGRVDVRGPLDGVIVASAESSLTLGMTCRPSHEWVLKVSREINRGEGLVLTHGGNDAWLGSIGFVF